MAFWAQNLNSTNNFGLHRHNKYISRATGNKKCRPSTVANHCGAAGESDIVNHVTIFTRPSLIKFSQPLFI